MEKHTHCWHKKRSPTMVDLKEGHVLQVCCKCDAERTVHAVTTKEK